VGPDRDRPPVRGRPGRHDLGDDGPDDQRRYDMVVTHDPELVIRAAEPLLRRLVPEH
jgi:hypothetical protein